jgi:hypothetical protein
MHVAQSGWAIANVMVISSESSNVQLLMQSSFSVVMDHRLATYIQSIDLLPLMRQEMAYPRSGNDAMPQEGLFEELY